MAFKLIVGLQNPGEEYEKTRHNAGAWLVQALASQYGVSFKFESKFHGHLTRFQKASVDCRFLLPTTYMNLSGNAIAAVCQFYKIEAQEVLVVHDEIDLSPGAIRLKWSGGSGGNNGLKDTIAKLGKDFWRLRIGVGHPGDRDQVVDYVLHQPSKADNELIHDAIDRALCRFDDLFAGETDKYMNELHRN